MNEENKKPLAEEEETEEEVESETVETLEAYGQMILGEVEKIGGILTADGIAQAEGEYNIEVGSLHQKVNKQIHSTDPDEETPKDEEE
jgi:hypothetical protein